MRFVSRRVHGACCVYRMHRVSLEAFCFCSGGLPCAGLPLRHHHPHGTCLQRLRGVSRWRRSALGRRRIEKGPEKNRKFADLRYYVTHN